MTENFNLTSGKNRALVCYCDCEEGDVYHAIKGVFDNAGIEIDEQSGVFSAVYPEPKSAFNIALQYADKIKRLKVGGTFNDVNVGVFFYDQPAPPEPEIVFVPTDELGNPIGEPEYSEPEPAPSITSLVCDALRDTFGGVYGASAFVVPNTVTEFTLEVE